jgi:glycosyltransferase involved in cell wall biosynthesis
LPDGIVADGTPITGQLPQNVQNKVKVVFNGVDTQVFYPGLDGTIIRRELGIEPRQVVIGHAARLTPWKGQHDLLEAFGGIADLFPQTCLLLAGSPLFDDDSYEKRLRARAIEMGLGRRVIFAGFREDLENVLAGMDVFAYPSLEKDTSPLSLISAMACGLPVAAFDIAGVREVLGDAGILLPVGCASELAAALSGLIQDPVRRQTLGKRARDRVLAQFTLEGYLAGMLRVFEMYGG